MRGKQVEKRKSVEMRKNGCSVKEIADSLKVSKGSVSRWVRDVELTSEQIEALESRRSHKGSYQSKMAGARANKEKWNKIRGEWRDIGKKLVSTDSEFRDSCLLYWAEGTKSRTAMKISNADWKFLGLFIRSMVKNFDVRKVSITIMFYENDICKTWDEAVEFWKSKFDVRIVKVDRRKRDDRADSGKSKNKLPYGVCEIAFYRSGNMIQAVYGGIEAIRREISGRGHSQSDNF